MTHTSLQGLLSLLCHWTSFSYCCRSSPGDGWNLYSFL